MTVSFDLPTELEDRLREEARRAGLDPAEYVRRFLASHLRDAGRSSGNGPTSGLARPDTGHLEAREAALLGQINLGLRPEFWAEYHELLRKRDSETLKPAEQRQLVDLSDQIEQANARRMGLLVELARLRGVSVEALMRDLGIAGGNHG